MKETRNKNSIVLGLALMAITTFSWSCQSSTKPAAVEEKKTEVSTTTSANTPPVNTAPVNTSSPEPKKEEKKGIVSASDKADITITAEALYKEFVAKDKPIEPPAKYVNKIIAISGRVADLMPEKSGVLAPRVTLKGGSSSIIDVVTCEFDEENKSEITKLKKDQTVKLQGLGPDTWLMTPSLQHCVILEGG
jgi:hypothetical protein